MIQSLKYSFFLLLLAGDIASAQDTRKTPPAAEATIRVQAKSYGDSVVIRWAPTTPGAWQLLNTVGYQVLRIGKNNTNNTWTTLTAKPILPLTLEQMKAVLGRDDKYGAIAAQALYGKTFTGMRGGVAPAVSDQASLLQDRYAFTLQAADFSAPVARAVGLSYVDKTASRGEAYIYKVVPAQEIKAMVVRPGSVILQNDPQSKPAVPEGLVAIGADHKVELQWPRAQEGGFTAYGVEVAEDGKNFRSITTAPYYSSTPDTAGLLKDSLVSRMIDLLQYNHILIDTLKENYKTYSYRIKGINAFAEWSGYSETVTVRGRDLTPPGSPVLGTPEYVSGKSLRLTWVKGEMEKDMKGYYVHRAPAVDGSYTLLTPSLLSPSTTSFTDTGAYEHGPNFYVVTAVDTAGNYNPSLPLMGLVPDTTAPARPTGLTGRIDKDGLVHLSWAQNREVDMEGYKVYYSHQPDQSFLQLTLYPEKANSFVDSITLKTLTKKIYYRVVAVDRNNNHSDFSPILELKKPDIIPPTPPAIHNVTVGSKSAQIEFAGSASTDAASYLVVRRENEGEWKALQRHRHDNTEAYFTVTDTTVRHGVRYDYAARTIDEDSLQSELCTPARVQIRGAEELPSIETLKATYSTGNNLVALTWTYKGEGDYQFVLYRSLKGEPLERYQTLPASVQQYNDAALPELSKGYQYAVQAVYKNNSKRTRLGKPVVVTK